MASSLTNINQWIGGGFARASFALSTSGLPYGTVPTAGNFSAMTILEGANAANPSLGAARILNIEGDDSKRGAIQFPSGESPTFDLTFVDFKGGFLNAIQGTTTDDAQSIYDVFLVDPEDPPTIDIFLLLTQKATSTTPAKKGSGYFNMVFPFCTAVFTTPPQLATGPTAGTYVFNVSVPGRVDQFAWGETITTVNHGTTGASAYFFFSDEIPTMDVFTQNAVLTTYSPSQTLNANEQVIAWNDITGTTAPLTITPNAGNFDFAAQASGEVTLFIYEVA
jgi:hypothetical protein